MNKRYICLLLWTFFMFFQSKIIVSAQVKYAPMTCEEKLKSLEPAKPETIYDYELLQDRNLNTFTEKVFPISKVLKSGSNVPFVSVYKDLNWQRPAYNFNYHSSIWRWSYVPLNLANQQHKVFSYQGGVSAWYDLSNYLALPEGISLSSPLNEYAFTIKYPYVVRLIVFNYNVKSMKYYKNQIAVFGEPLRKGVTLVDFDTRNFTDSKKLLQLVTPDGYELDYLILYLSK